MQRLRVLVSLSILAFITGCTEPGETTAVGAATGGAIGAGLGAIVGSQVGSAGGGLAIGMVSGAAAGGLIGNKLEAQDEAIRTQDEALERQQQMMEAHERQLRELRHARDEGTAVAPPSGDLMGYSYPGSRKKLSASDRQRLSRSLPVDEASARARYRVEPEPVAGRSRGAVAPSRSPSSSVSFKSAPSYAATQRSAVTERSVMGPNLEVERTAAKAVEPKLSAPKSTGSGLVERDIAVPDSAPEVSMKSFDSEPSEVIPPAPEEMDGAPAVEKEAVAVVKSAPSEDAEKAVPAKLSQAPAPKTGGAECQKAGDEIDKAKGSKDVADKLFHYRRALRLCPNEPQYHYGLGQVYQSLDRTSDAEFEYREALRLNPSMKEARESLDKLRF